MNSTLKLRPREAFENFDSFLSFLKERQFDFKIQESSQLAANWELLDVPLNSTFASPKKSNFCYTTKNKSPVGSWGLVFRNLNTTNLAPNEIAIDAPEAALDVLLRKLVPSEWIGSKEYAVLQDKKYSHVICEVGVVIGPDCEIGPGVTLETGVRIGARVKIGTNTRIGTGSRIADDTIIGDNCYFRGPVSLGGQGFGFITYPKSPVPRHRVHVGRVIVGDNVQLGSFVSIDRGVLEDTVLGSFSATDNSVHIGHNCKVGKHAVLCAFVGMAGSTIVGDYVTMGGLVMTKGHLTIGDKVQIGGFSGVYDDVPSGAQLRGVPARPIKQDLKIMAIQEKLPELYSSLKLILKSQDLK